jgi:DNA-binding NtrC family response regulator
LDALLQIARRMFMADHGAIVSYHSAFDKWYVESWYGFAEDPNAEEDVKQYSKTILKQAYQSDGILLISDADANDLTRDSKSIKQYSIKSVMCAPFLDAQGHVLGVIYLDSSSVTGAFDETSRQRLAKLARFCGLGIQRCLDLRQRNLSAPITSSATDSEHGVFAFRSPAMKKIMPTDSEHGVFAFRSPAMKKIMQQLERVRDDKAPILLLGESGVGKDYLAAWVHRTSNRNSGPFVPINLPDLPTELVQSLLFGIEANVATGVAGRDGLIRNADGGTAFLNEISELPLDLQAVLLGVLESDSVRRVSGHTPFPISVRYISATNQNLEHLVEKGRFRHDLYYRINVISVLVPPLRERPEDIEPLAEFLLAKKCEGRNRKPMRIPKSVIRQMEDMPWSGNVRELANKITQVVLNHDGDEFPRLQADGEVDVAPKRSRERIVGRSMKDQIREYEKELIESALHDTGWVQVRAARMLRISEASLRDKMKRLKIEKPRKLK